MYNCTILLFICLIYSHFGLLDLAVPEVSWVHLMLPG